MSCETPTSRPVLRVLLDNSLSHKSFLMLSNHSHFGLPLLLFPAPPSPSLSCLRIHFLFSIHAHTISTFVVPLIHSFLILSSLVTPLIHLNILISATSNFFSCAFFIAHVSAPYIIQIIMVKVSHARGQHYVPRFLCSPIPMFPKPMFPGTDVPRFLYFNSRL